ncbi:hypothetical protein V2A60_002451 [Cordyceps javanica]
MVTFTKFAAGIAAIAIVASGAALKARLAHDKVVEFPETLPEGLRGELYKRYQPFLEVHDGCIPFPAVDKDGNVNDGLDKGDGGPSNECDFGKGQVYARGAVKDGKFGLMYSWYFPKDVTSPGVGHRHDWENIVLWFDGERADAAYLGVAISAHGGYKKYKAGDKAVSWEGDRPLIAYENEIVTHHHLGVTGKKGGDQPILGYEKIPDVAWKALDEYNFGDADLPFGTKNFDKLIGDSMP